MTTNSMNNGLLGFGPHFLEGVCRTGGMYPHGLQSEFCDEGNEAIFSDISAPEYISGGAMKCDEDWLGVSAYQYIVRRDAHA